jgi:hypothetical protein
MNAIAKPSQVVVRMSPHHVVTHQRPRVHETGGLGETLWGTQLVSVPRRYPQDYDPRRHGLEKLENHLHQGGGGLAHLLGWRALKNLAWSF